MMKLILTILLLGAVSVVGQTSTANLKGTVYDVNGAVIQAAKITVINKNGKEFFGLTNANGRYEVKLPVESLVVNGKFKIPTYTIVVTADYFESSSINDFRLVSGSNSSMELDIALDVLDKGHEMEFPLFSAQSY